MKRLSALDVLKSVRKEMNPDANIGEYTLPVILKAMHVYATSIEKQEKDYYTKIGDAEPK